MRKTIYICDVCGKEIPTKTKKDVFGIERVVMETEIVKVCENPFPVNQYLDLCSVCALKLSLDLTNFVHSATEVSKKESHGGT